MFTMLSISDDVGDDLNRVLFGVYMHQQSQIHFFQTKGDVPGGIVHAEHLYQVENRLRLLAHALVVDPLAHRNVVKQILHRNRSPFRRSRRFDLSIN